MSSDLGLLLDDVRNDLEFLSKCWKLQGRPIYIFLIREQNLRGSQRHELLDMLSQFKQGKVNDVCVRMERLQTLISSASLEHLDFLDEDSDNLEFLTLKELETDNLQYKSLSDLPKLMPAAELEETSKAKLEDFKSVQLNELIGLLHTTTSRLTKALILHELYNRYGAKLQIQESNIEEMIWQLNSDAISIQNWRIVRYCTSVLHKTVDSLAPSITNILVRGKIITLGVFGGDEVEITKPLAPDKIKEILYEKVFPHDVYQAVLMQELIINISKYISCLPEMFKGIMKLRLGWIVEVMKQELESSKMTDPENNEPLVSYVMLNLLILL
jgi:phosphorylase kinase alpha/beta subunit